MSSSSRCQGISAGVGFRRQYAKRSARRVHAGALGDRDDVRCGLVTVPQPCCDTRIAQSGDGTAERRTDLMSFQHRRPRLAPNVPVGGCGQRSPVVQNEYQIVGAEAATSDLLPQDRDQGPAYRNVPHGGRGVGALYAALSPPRVDQQEAVPVIVEFHFSHS
ncbi:hypothetical protein [Streptomyces sp. NPDC046887]|uniref:hypothetical protein n=1 Tax=Streptomyces sp. NPDC046887 TaxID=3155472 RepID=UPI0033C2B1DA